MVSKNVKGGPFGTLKYFQKKVAQCRKNQKGGPLASAAFVGYVKKVKKGRGDPLETNKISKKKSQCRKKKRKKIERGDSLVSSGFVGYVKIKKMTGGTLLH